MPNILWLAGLAALFAISASAPAQAVDYPRRAYEATYITTGPTGTTTMRLASDGKGHTMSETEAGLYHVISILDYPGKVCLMIRPEQKRILKMAMEDGQNNLFEGTAEKPPNATSLGSKVIDGHPCKGWKYGSAASGQIEIWLADDIELAVKTIITPKVGGTRTTVLKSYSAATPPAATFAAPVGYSIIEKPMSPAP